MPAWFWGVLVNGAIPLLGGVYATLLAFRLVGPKPGVNPTQDEWHRRWGGIMRVGGPLLVVFAVFLWVKGVMDHSNPAPPTPTVWVRHKSEDGTASAEFPAPPAFVTKQAEGVVNHNVTLSQKERDCHFILSWSEVGSEPGVGADELLDRLREFYPIQMTQQGKEMTFVSEERIGDDAAPGRILVFNAGNKHTQRMKCFIFNGRFYRALATTTHTPQEDADGVRFVSSFRLEKSAGTR
jgi:hypothetical protein